MGETALLRQRRFRMVRALRVAERWLRQICGGSKLGLIARRATPARSNHPPYHAMILGDPCSYVTATT
jgi:hypothetical protein